MECMHMRGGAYCDLLFPCLTYTHSDPHSRVKITAQGLFSCMIKQYHNILL